LNIGALRETFYKYWNLPPGTVSKPRPCEICKDRARIMSRAYQYPYPPSKRVTDEPKKEINDDRQISN